MPELLTFSCPSCKTKLTITSKSIKEFLCNTCGHTIVVKSECGITYLEEKEKSIDDLSPVILSGVSLDETSEKPSQDMPVGTATEMPTSSNPKSFEHEEFFDGISSDITNQKIIEKISRLQNSREMLLQGYKKTKMVGIVICLVTLILIYLLLPVYSSYEELFKALGITFIPVILVFTIFLLVRRNAVLSNINYINQKIDNIKDIK